MNHDPRNFISRPIEEVFDLVADERNELRYNPSLLQVEQVTGGSIGRGTQFRAEALSRGRPVEMTIEYTDFQRPRLLSSTTHLDALDISGTLKFEPVPEGTRMRWSWALSPRGVLKVASPLIVFLGKRQEVAIWRRLKTFMEAEPKAD